jgi:hypothetical protein
MTRTVVLLVALDVLSGTAVGAGGEEAMFKVTSKKADDAVEIRAHKDKTVFVIKSPSGISQAVIERTSENWPEVVLLRLNLKGLENFKASNVKVTLEAAVSSQKEGKQVRLWKDGKEDTPLDAKHSHWMEIRMVGSDGNPAKEIPLMDGYFEMQLPKAFFEGNPKSITLNWIDFHRN